jgi:hypothetical protein
MSHAQETKLRATLWSPFEDARYILDHLFVLQSKASNCLSLAEQWGHVYPLDTKIVPRLAFFPFEHKHLWA